MARYTYDITIIGGGSGGLTAARLAQALGARVALIDKERLGGDCLHYGCVPSKSLIHVAKVAQQARHAAQIGLAAAELTPDMAKVTAYVQGVIERASEAEKTYTEGVDVRLGAFEFRSNHEFLLNGVPLSSQSFIVATGSRPVVPNVEGSGRDRLSEQRAGLRPDAPAANADGGRRRADRRRAGAGVCAAGLEGDDRAGRRPRAAARGAGCRTGSCAGAGARRHHDSHQRAHAAGAARMATRRWSRPSRATS